MVTHNHNTAVVAPGVALGDGRGGERGVREKRGPHTRKQNGVGIRNTE